MTQARKGNNGVWKFVATAESAVVATGVAMWLTITPGMITRNDVREMLRGEVTEIKRLLQVEFRKQDAKMSNFWDRVSREFVRKDEMDK